jgi:hypothetical protein
MDSPSMDGIGSTPPFRVIFPSYFICTDAALKEGGYEPTMSAVGPPSEARLKAAVEELLK